MVAERDGIHARAENGLGDGARDARAGRGVLAVRDDKIDLMLEPDRPEPLVDDIPARPADDVADK